MSIRLVEEYIETGNLSALSTLLRSEPWLVDGKTSHQVSPLLLSCYYKKAEITRLLLEYVSELTIFEAAATGKLDQVTDQVHQHREQLNSYSADGFTPLGLACYFGHEEVVRYLLFKGSEVDVPSKNGFSVYPINSAVAANNAEITKLLLEAGADVNVAQYGGVTPLHSAASHGNIELIILLLEAGASISARTDDGKTPSLLAADKGFADIARILRE